MNFAPLAGVAGVQLVSLQTAWGTEQLRDVASHWPVINLENRLGYDSESFANLAAIIKNLDLVITCDTAIAHLAGALGVNVWVALPFAPDWRWLTKREDSPWYLFMRLFRQTRPGDWQDVFSRIAQALKSVVPDNASQTAATHAHHQLAIPQSQQSKPADAEAMVCLANTLVGEDRVDEAIELLHAALRQKPDMVEAHNNLGVVLTKQHKFTEALAAYDQALRHDPEHAEAHLNRGMLRLTFGDWQNGLADYEWRTKTKNFAEFPFHQPRWDGSPLAGRTLLLAAEQGLGDTLQFIRYAPLMQERGERVLVQCQPVLWHLLAHGLKTIKVFAAGSPLPAFDVYAPMMSMAHLLGTTPARIRADVPYLHAEAQRLHHWQRDLQSLAGFKIGIAWQGSRSHNNDRKRSIALKHFAPLAALDGVHLVSLQRGRGTEQLRSRRPMACHRSG